MREKLLPSSSVAGRKSFLWVSIIVKDRNASTGDSNMNYGKYMSEIQVSE